MPFAICITKCIPAGIRTGETLGILRVLEWEMARSGGFEPLTSAFGGPFKQFLAHLLASFD